MNKEKINLADLDARTVERMKKLIIESVIDETDYFILASMIKVKNMPESAEYGFDPAEEYTKQMVKTMVEEYGFDIEEAEEAIEELLNN